MKAALIWGIPLLFLATCAVLLFVVSGMEFNKLRAYADGIAGDGVAESFTNRIHGNMVQRARWLAGFLSVAALLWAALRSRIMAFATNLIAERAQFRKDSAKARRKVKKFTSRTHKRAVYAILAIGALLRIFFLFEPITYDEAFTYVHYISKPLSVLLSDYSYPNNHIFHNLLAKLFTSILGGSPIPLRLTALIFGLLFMPLVYFFTRAMFNRYIAMTTLALVASAGGFVEYSALARGYSITWVCFVLGLMLGRYYLKKNSLYVMLLLGVVNAFGLWAVPTMIYPAMGIYLWLFLVVSFKYNRSVNQRMYKLLMSFLVMIGMSAVCYMPVILTYGVGQLFSHPTMGDTSWGYFSEQYPEQIHDVWVYLTQTSAVWIILVLLTSALFAVVISSKFRGMAAGAVAAILPMILIQSVIAPPRVWNFAMLFLYISGGIGLFYFLKFVQSKVIKDLSKRGRTIASSAIIVFGCGFLTYNGVQDRVFRMHEAEGIASYFSSVLEPNDKVFVVFPIEAQIEYHFMISDIEMVHLYGEPEKNEKVYVLVNSKKQQSLEEVLEAKSKPEYFQEAVLLEERGNTTIYRTELK